jgi:Predicted permeases
MLLFLVSIISGIISGMGIGGGTILIPALIILFNTDQHIAQSVNLLSFIPIAIVALITHIKNKNVETKLSTKITVFGIIGAIAGSILASKLPTPYLRKLFALFLFIMGIYELCIKKK